MQYRTQGGTGIKVRPYALGTLTYATRMGTAPEESARIVHKALDADMNFHDTADAYGDSEEFAGKARGLPDAMIEAIAAGKRPEFESGSSAP
jgi:aryl-alcohol dehydrogenase-like predicted oxidoreductase